MNLDNVIRGAVLGLALTGFATAADATVFRIDSLSFGGSAFTETPSDPGLVVQTHSLAPKQFELNGVGDSAWVSLFDIWSEECCVDGGDTTQRSFSLGLHFDLPPPPFSGTAPGDTTGGFLLFGFIPIGLPYLSWTDNVVDIAFGTNGDGLLRLTLFDTGFEYDCHDDQQDGDYNKKKKKKHDDQCRTTVKGKFKLISDPTPPTPPTDVPEPGTIALLGAGMLGLGLLRRRRAA